MEALNRLLALTSVAGVGALCIAVLVLRHLSQRLAAITRQRPRHHWYVVSAVALGCATLSRLLTVFGNGWLGAPWALVHDVFLMAGLVIAVRTSVYYWGWLFGERGRQPDQ